MGESQEKTEFHNIVAWGDLAKSFGETVKKGRKVYVAGRLQTRSWETPDGQKRWTTEIVADRALALGVVDSELGTPEGGEAASAESKVVISEPVVKGEESASAEPSSDKSTEVTAPAEAEKVVPDNPTEVPAVNYESEIKPEDLPF